MLNNEFNSDYSRVIMHPLAKTESIKTPKGSYEDVLNSWGFASLTVNVACGRYPAGNREQACRDVQRFALAANPLLNVPALLAAAYTSEPELFRLIQAVCEGFELSAQKALDKKGKSQS